MKYTFTLIIAATLLAGSFSTAQNVGVNTNAPTANLDVNGTLRVRSLEKTNDGFQATGNVLYIMGVDANGNVIPIEIDENIILEGNKLKVQLPETDSSVAELPNGETLEDNYSNGSSRTVNDLDLGIVILPGDRRGTWPVISLPNGNNSEQVDITGFKSVADGTIVYLYPTSGDVRLLRENGGSQTQNRIKSEKNVTVKKNTFLQIMYDANIGKWVIPYQPPVEED